MINQNSNALKFYKQKRLYRTRLNKITPFPDIVEARNNLARQNKLNIISSTK